MTEEMDMTTNDDFAEPEEPQAQRRLTDAEKRQRLLERSTGELLPGGWDVIYTSPREPQDGERE
jgi:hypothetical protein